MKDFEYAKKQAEKQAKKKKMRWWVRIGNDRVYIWALPLYGFVILADKFDNWKYNRLIWDEAKAQKVLDYALPKTLEYIAEEDAYYFNTCWNLGKKNVPWYLRSWASKFANKLTDYLVDTYQKDGYEKEFIEDDYDNWVVFRKEG